MNDTLSTSIIVCADSEAFARVVHKREGHGALSLFKELFNISIEELLSWPLDR